MTKSNKKRLNLTNIQKKYLFNTLNISSIDEIDTSILKLLKERLKKVSDKRQQHKILYKIWDIIIYVVIANFSNIFDWEDIEIFVKNKSSWFKNFLQMSGGVPSAQTIERVFSLIDSKELENILTNFFLEITHVNDNNNDIINIDGRVDRGSKRNETNYNNKINPLNVLNAYSNKYGICLSSEIIDDKSNEIPSIPLILDNLNIENNIVTWDALNTQKENVKAVTSKNGFYVVPIKANHLSFYDDLRLYFNNDKLESIIAGNSNSAYLKHIEKSHSSIIKYEYFQTTDTNWYYDKDNWSELNSIGLAKKTITTNNKNTIEYKFYISNLFLDINNFSNAIRLHWSVENKLHWHLDFTFREDNNLTVNKQALMNLQIINKFTLAVLNKVKPFYNGLSLKKIRTHITCDFETNFIDLLCYLLCS